MESNDGLLGDLLSGDLGATGTGGDHVGLKKDTFEEDVVVVECLEDSSVDLLEDSQAGVDVVVTIAEDFGFNNGDKTVVLADRGVSSKTPSVFLDGEVTGATIGRDLKDSSPLGESATDLVEFSSALGEVIETNGGGFTVLGSWDLLATLVNL